MFIGYLMSLGYFPHYSLWQYWFNWKNSFSLIMSKKITRDILKWEKKLKLFSNMDLEESVRIILVNEHESITILATHGLWKDVYIKMGSILEYILKNWYLTQGISNIPSRGNTKVTSSTFGPLIRDFINNQFSESNG